MKIVYIISAYKLPEQFIRLVSKLNAPNTIFFIHIDKKVGDEIFRKMSIPFKDYPNVHFLKRHACYWGDFGHVRATLKGINEIITQEINYDYVVLLTGQDYPIKSNNQIQEFFRQNSGKSFINYVPLPYAHWYGNGGLDRVNKWHFYWRSRCLELPPKINPQSSAFMMVATRFLGKFQFTHKLREELEFFGGGSYWCLTKESIEYIYEFTQSHPDFVSFFKFVYIPDEIFFQTLLVNSNLKEKIINRDLRYIEWCRPKPPYPAILQKADYPQFIKSDNLFARKFDITVDKDVLDMIDRYICD